MTETGTNGDMRMDGEQVTGGAVVPRQDLTPEATEKIVREAAIQLKEYMDGRQREMRRQEQQLMRLEDALRRTHRTARVLMVLAMVLVVVLTGVVGLLNLIGRRQTVLQEGVDASSQVLLRAATEQKIGIAGLRTGISSASAAVRSATERNQRGFSEMNAKLDQAQQVTGETLKTVATGVETACKLQGEVAQRIDQQADVLRKERDAVRTGVEAFMDRRDRELRDKEGLLSVRKAELDARAAAADEERKKMFSQAASAMENQLQVFEVMIDQMKEEAGLKKPGVSEEPKVVEPAKEVPAPAEVIENKDVPKVEESVAPSNSVPAVVDVPGGAA